MGNIRVLCKRVPWISCILLAFSIGATWILSTFPVDAECCNQAPKKAACKLKETFKCIDFGETDCPEYGQYLFQIGLFDCCGGTDETKNKNCEPETDPSGIVLSLCYSECACVWESGSCQIDLEFCLDRYYPKFKAVPCVP